MGACFHIAGVFCDNCRPASRGIVSGPITVLNPLGDLPRPPALATASELNALRAEVAALRVELERLTSEFVQRTNTHISRIIEACPKCGNKDLIYSTFSYGERARQQIACECGWARYA